MAMTASPACPHGITLDKFCHELHLDSQARPDAKADGQPACPHGVALATFCRELHGGEPR
jgi:hypothetical protein